MVALVIDSKDRERSNGEVRAIRLKLSRKFEGKPHDHFVFSEPAQGLTHVCHVLYRLLIQNLNSKVAVLCNSSVGLELMSKHWLRFVKW